MIMWRIYFKCICWGYYDIKNEILAYSYLASATDRGFEIYPFAVMIVPLPY